MRLLQAPPTLLSTIVLLLASSRHSQAAPEAPEIILDEDSADLQLQNATFGKRWGAACQYGACGVDQTICCNTGAGSWCSTDAWSTAYCITGAAQAATTPAPAAASPTGEGHYTYWTVTTYETDTVPTTYIYSSWVSVTTEVQAQTCPMDWAGMTTLCGNVCCATSQYCNAGTCTTNAGAYTVTGAGATAGTRGTSVTGVIQTSTITPTVTTGFGTPVPVSSGNATLVGASSSSGLSAGAIAGIVIGVIFGVILLLLICLACCLKAGIDSIFALFGLGNRRHRRGRVVEEEVIERRRRGGTAASGRWYGAGYADRPGGRTSVTRIEERRRTGGWGGLGAGVGGLAVALGLKRREDDRRRRRDKDESESSYDYSSYDYSDYLSGTSEGRSDVRREVRRETIRRDSRRDSRR